MALRSNKVSATRTPKRPTLGAVRRTQLITTYGVGSMIAIGDQSFIVSGLDTWNVADAPTIRDFRLQTRLGVRRFHLPPSSNPPAGDGVRVRRFPEIYTCPGRSAENPDGCEANLRRFDEFNSPRGKGECAACHGQLTPSRFVVACKNGHLDDFPYWNWVHNRTPGGGEISQHRLSFRSTGRTASLRSIIVGCSCGKEASMEGAFGVGALGHLGYTCRGGRPWLGRDGRQSGCAEQSRTLQRGSSAVWFPAVRSALSIPPFTERLHDAVYQYLPMWAGEKDDDIARLAAKVLDTEFAADEVIKAVRDYEDYEAGERSEPSTPTGFEAADVLREEEFKQLCHESVTPQFECVTARSADGVSLPPGIAASMLVNRLREVRVLQAFTRLEAPMEGDTKDRLAALSASDVDWLPGVEVIGEGVFLKLDIDRIREWEQASGADSPAARTAQIRAHHDAVLRKRADAAGRPAPRSEVTSRFVLVHTLAHGLINEWSLDAGYPAAALRERLYVSDTMAGILIYTATSDSAGSLGGLVSEGRPERLRSTLEAALRRIAWCSADPLCMESEAAGADSLNLAACHACMLIPETSCETNNCFLDRAMLIGTPDRIKTGYFATKEPVANGLAQHRRGGR